MRNELKLTAEAGLLSALVAFAGALDTEDQDIEGEALSAFWEIYGRLIVRLTHNLRGLRERSDSQAIAHFRRAGYLDVNPLESGDKWKVAQGELETAERAVAAARARLDIIGSDFRAAQVAAGELECRIICGDETASLSDLAAAKNRFEDLWVPRAVAHEDWRLASEARDQARWHALILRIDVAIDLKLHDAQEAATARARAIMEQRAKRPVRQGGITHGWQASNHHA